MADAATVSVLLRADDQLSAKLAQAQGKILAFGQQAGAAGRGLLALSAPLVAIGALSLKAFTDFESSFAGVRKTVNATEEQFKELAAGFRTMAREIPVNVNELNRIGEAAGQLGIKTENILLFSRTMADLGVTTNLSSDMAATALARLANITQLPQNQVNRLGAAIVALGNNLATTEAEIVDFGLRIAGAGKISGLTEAQILAIGGAMSSVGVQAEAGGTAVQKVLLSMTEQVATSGEQLEIFAATAGMTAAEFSKAFKEDAGGAFTAFVEGLGRAGTDAFGILEQLGLEDQRLIRSFLSLAGAGDLLRTSIDLGTKAFADNAALTEEAEKRYATVASQFAILKNELQDVAITIGGNLTPSLLGLVKAASPIVDNMGEWAERNPGLTTTLIAVAVAVAGLGTALIALGLVLPGITAAIGLLSGAVGILGGALTLLAAHPVILAVIGLTALVGLIYLATQRLQNMKSHIDETADAMGRMGTNWQDVSLPMEERLKALNTYMEEASGTMGKMEGAAKGVVIHGLDPMKDAALDAKLAGERLRQELAALSTQAVITAADLTGIKIAIEGLVTAHEAEILARMDILAGAEMLGITLDQILLQMADLTAAGLSEAAASEVVYSVLKGRVKEFLSSVAAAREGGIAMLAALEAAGVGFGDMFGALLTLPIKLAEKTEKAADTVISNFERMRDELISVKGDASSLTIEWEKLRQAGLGSAAAFEVAATVIGAQLNKELAELASKLEGGEQLLAAMQAQGLSLADMFKVLTSNILKTKESILKTTQALVDMSIQVERAIAAQAKPKLVALEEQLAAAKKEMAETRDVWRQIALPSIIHNLERAIDLARAAEAARQGLGILGLISTAGGEQAEAARRMIEQLIPSIAPPTLPGLPTMQQGGLVTRPTLAFLGERGPEAVIPLGRNGAGSSLTINTTINGPVFGERDLEDKVAQIWRDVARAGGFRGLI